MARAARKPIQEIAVAPPVQASVVPVVPPMSSDNVLVAAAAQGDEAAFATLFERHRQLVSRLGYRFFSRREQVEEIIQDTFTKAYFALNDYQGGYEGSFPAWLTRIAVHTCYDELRRQKRRSESNIGDLTEDEAAFLNERLRDASPGSNVEGTTLTRDLASKLMSRLKPEDRLVLTLVNLEERSIAEIAVLMGWTPGKVKMRAFRAREALRDVLHRFV
jgi:RNA polymerase sigma-70 factor (ECF subfamily)